VTAVVYYVAASEDGFIAAPGDGLDWLPVPDPQGEDHGYAAFLETVEGVAMGRGTWRVMQTLGEPWPYGARPGWVFTRGPLHTDAPVLGTSLDLPALRADWATRGLARVWLVGGGDVAGQFAAAGAIDELILTTVPVRLGAGVPLFGARGAALDGWREVAPTRRWFGGIVQRVLRPTALGDR
jgi:dihydrofolate reductase